MKDISVGIVKSDFHGNHSGSWSNEWVDYCVDNHISHELIDWRENDAFEKLRKKSVVVWHYSHYSSDEMNFAPAILDALKESGCIVFPDHNDTRHFDDKVIQSYLLKSLNLPTPKNYPLHSADAVEDWIESDGKFPVVAKLRAGSGASNVILIKSPTQLERYTRQMFGRGLNSKPNVFFKIKSNASSAKSFTQALSRLKRAPEFLFARKMSAGRGREKGYVYLQEFIDGVDYDLKVVVIGEKLSFLCRGVRKGDFRASGGGDIFYDHKLVTPKVIEIAFAAAKALKSDCIGFDMVINPTTMEPLIIEMSYGFSHTALMEAGGYYTIDGKWHECPLDAPKAVLEYLLYKANLENKKVRV